ARELARQVLDEPRRLRTSEHRGHAVDRDRGGAHRAKLESEPRDLLCAFFEQRDVRLGELDELRDEEALRAHALGGVRASQSVERDALRGSMLIEDVEAVLSFAHEERSSDLTDVPERAVHPAAIEEVRRWERLWQGARQRRRRLERR